MKILILRFSSLGDIVMLTALPRAIKNSFPGSRLDIAVRSDFVHLVKFNPNINNVHVIDRKDGILGLIRLIKDIRKLKYDIIVDAHRSIRSKLVCFFTPGVRKFYFNKRTFNRFFLILFKLNFFREIIPQMLEYIKPLKKIGVYYDSKGTEIFLSEQSTFRAEKIIKNLKLDKGTRIIGMVPSANWPGKRWPASYFAELSKLILRDMKAVILVVGGSSDTFCETIASSSEDVVNFAGKLSMIESSALLSKCDIVISNDTGMMHVAEAVGVDVISIMGPTSKEFGCYPYRQGSVVVELKMWCRPCSKNGKGPCIRLGRRPCLYKISPSMVLSSLKKWYKKRGEISGEKPI